MKVLIIEDEVPAAEKLQRYLGRYNPDVEVLARLDSVAESSRWLKANQEVLDLIFMDIQLLDGKSFEIFNHVEITKPIVFITAFDEYAIDAFKANSIDYLLKPLTYIDLTKALEKLNRMKEELSAKEPNLNKALLQLKGKSYKTRFMVKLGEHIKSITTDRIALFYADGRSVYLVTDENRKFIIDFRLEDLEELLNPEHFFRMNRTFIMHIESIKDVVVYSNSRLKISSNVKLDKEIIVSRDKVGDFKQWFDGM